MVDACEELNLILRSFFFLCALYSFISSETSLSISAGLSWCSLVFCTSQLTSHFSTPHWTSHCFNFVFSTWMSVYIPSQLTVQLKSLLDLSSIQVLPSGVQASPSWVKKESNPLFAPQVLYYLHRRCFISRYSLRGIHSTPSIPFFAQELLKLYSHITCTVYCTGIIAFSSKAASTV